MTDELEKIRNERDNTNLFNAFLRGYQVSQEVRLDNSKFEDKGEFEAYLRKRFLELVKNE